MARTKRYRGSLRWRAAGYWQWRVRIDGTRHSFRIEGTRVNAENFAIEKAKELKREVGRTRRGLPGTFTFRDLITEYRRVELPSLNPGGQRSYENSLKIFEVYFVEQRRDPPVTALKRADVKAFLTWRRSHKLGKDGPVAGTLSPHTVRRDLRVLSLLFSFALDTLELIEHNPCYKVRGPRTDPRTPVILTPDEYERLLGECNADPMLALFVLMLGETGARSVSEVLRLRWEDVDLAEGFVRITSRPGARTKTGRTRWTPLTARSRGALADHMAAYRLVTYDGQRSAWLFHHVTTRRAHRAGQPIRDGFRTAFAKARERAELPEGFRPHDLRHRRITTWLADGGDVTKVKEAVGHASLATTMGYTHLAREHLRSLVEKKTRKSGLQRPG